MAKFWRLALLTLLASGLLATAVLARPVYLTDGSRIEAQSVWKADGMIMVLVNRDSLISFYPHEVDLKKTFAAKPRKSAVKKAAPALQPAAAATVPATAPADTPKTAASAAPAAAGATPAPKPAPATAPAPAATPKPTAPAAATAAPAVAKAPAATAAPVPAAKPAPAAPATPAATAPAATAPAATAPAAKPAAPPAQAAPATVTPAPKPAAPATAAKPAVRPKPAPAPAPEPEMMLDPDLLLMVGGGFLVFLLLILASVWKVFVKAGEAGWKSLIPIYNVIVLLRIAGCPLWWFLMLLIPVISIYFYVVMNIRLADKFGKGAGFGIGLALFGFIFFPLLAFGSATYAHAYQDDFSFEDFAVEEEQ